MYAKKEAWLVTFFHKSTTFKGKVSKLGCDAFWEETGENDARLLDNHVKLDL